jgi:hypothetical protein
MSQKFPIYRVEPAYRSIAITQSDSEGRFYKYWCNHPQLGSCLFKAAAPDGFTPEQRRLDWSEKTAAELGKLLGLPVARTELAIGFDSLGGEASPTRAANVYSWYFVCKLYTEWRTGN